MQVLPKDRDKQQRMLEIIAEAQAVVTQPSGVHVPEDVAKAIQQLHQWLTTTKQEDA
jgi:hypothetical protein